MDGHDLAVSLPCLSKTGPPFPGPLGPLLGHPFSGALLHFHQISSYSGIFFDQTRTFRSHTWTHLGPLGPHTSRRLHTSALARVQRQRGTK
jgi:hypothetical protein